MSIDYDQLHRTIEEIEQGANATTKYSWIELARELLQIRREIGELRDEVARTATDCAILDNHEGRLAARIAQAVANRLFLIPRNGDH